MTPSLEHQAGDKKYRNELRKCLTELLASDDYVQASVSELKEKSSQKRAYMEQIKKLKEQNPDNPYLDTPLATIRDDIALDEQAYRLQEQQVKNVSRSFFKRFTSN